MTKLTGLLTAALDDPALARARDLARAGGPDAGELDLTAPPALRPFVIGATSYDLKYEQGFYG